MIEHEAKIRCDRKGCEETAQMLNPVIGGQRVDGPWLLPDGWVKIEQGVGIYMGGTAPIPPQVDKFAAGRTYCSIAHTIAGLAELKPLPERAEGEL